LLDAIGMVGIALRLDRQVLIFQRLCFRRFAPGILRFLIVGCDASGLAVSGAVSSGFPDVAGAGLPSSDFGCSGFASSGLGWGT
ncbi:hypothetical protein, partial [Bacillus sp. SIMBA_033]|uniref:hypothetical protein n=1 Tax=Bacillus sp. SIMBA_033 TaxID=3085776 RepID=UPI00397AE585